MLHSTVPASRFRLALLIISIVAAGILVRFHLPVPETVRDAAGGAAYVVAVVLSLMLLWPRLAPVAAAALGTALTCAVEFSQLISHPWLDAVRANRFGRLALGTTFSWADFGPYAAGGLLAWGIAAMMQQREA